VAIEGRETTLLAWTDPTMTNRELTERVGEVDDSPAHAVRRLEKRIQDDPRLDRAFEILHKEIARMS